MNFNVNGQAAQKEKKSQHFSVRNSLMAKVMIWVGIPVLCFFCIAAFLVLNNVRQSVKEITGQQLKAESQQVSNQIGEFFTGYQKTVDSLAANTQIYQMLQDTMDGTDVQKSKECASVERTMENIQKTDPDNIGNCWVGIVGSNQTLPSTGHVTNLTTSIKKRPWYSLVASKKAQILTDPYIAVSTKKACVSIVSPVYQTGTQNLIGVAGIDLNVDKLTTMVKNYKVGQNGFLILTSDTGTVLSAPDKKWVGKTLSNAGVPSSLSSAITGKSSKLIQYRANGTMNYGYVSRIGTTGWSVTTGLPENEYFGSVISVRNTMIAVYGISLLLLLLLLYFIARSITRPLKRLQGSAQQIADGDLNVAVDVRSSDEIGKVAAAISHIVNRLKNYVQYIDEITSVLHQIGEGNLIYKLQNNYVGEFSKIKDALLEIHDSLATTFSGISQATDEVASGSEQVAAGAQSLAQGSSEQASSVEELTAAATEISQKVDHNTSDVKEADQLTSGTWNDMQQSQNLMKKLSSSIDEISDSSRQIGQILKTIEDIAFQTNILALNAAVEAARAGEAGKGFSVVADEVRNLAAKSSQAAKTTASLIEASVRSVESGTAVVGETKDTFAKVADSVHRTADLMTSIAKTSEEQATTIRQIQQGLDQISATVQTNSATAEEEAASSEELSGQAQQMKALIEKFKFEK